MNTLTLRHWGWLLVVAVAVQLVGCGGGHRSAGGDAITTVVQTAQQQVGIPYRWGGESPQGFDCSGLVRYAYRSVGVDVPHSTEGLLDRVDRVPLSQIRPGDILFFKVAPPKISHVGLYVGDDRFIHAPSSGKTVSYGSLKNPYWNSHVVAAGRVF